MSRDPGFGGAARLCLAVGGLGGRFLRMLARVQRVVERLAVVALVDRFVRFLQRRGGGGVLVGGVLVGAGGARGIDRALRLVDLFLRGFASSLRRTSSRQCRQPTGDASRRKYSRL